MNGTALRIASPADAIRAGIAYVPEDRRQHGVVLDMSIAANTSLASLDAVSRHGLIDRGRERAAAQEYVDRLRIKTPSVARRRRHAVGREPAESRARTLAVAPVPSVIILDEPTQGVDVGSKAEIHALMQMLAARGLAIIMISSELPEILGMSDRIAVMHRGTIRGVLDRAEATQSTIMALALGTGHDPLRCAASDDGKRRWRVRSSRWGWCWRRSTPGFFARDNLSDLFLANMPVLIIALGMTLVILTGHIDISVGSLFAICAVISGVLAKAGLPMPLVVVAACAIGALLGIVNGVAGGVLPHPVDRRHAGHDDRAARGTALGDRRRVDPGSARPATSGWVSDPGRIPS